METEDYEQSVWNPQSVLTSYRRFIGQLRKVQPGHEVLILVHIDGLYGRDKLVDQEAISWIQAGVKARGANASILRIDEPANLMPGDFLRSSRLRCWAVTCLGKAEAE